MNVIGGEFGPRPTVWTKARRFAPQGCRAIVEALERCDFADVGAVALDWDNSLNRQPDEAAKPVIIVQILKFVDDTRRLEVEVRLDVEDIFSADEFSQGAILDIIHAMESKMLSELEAYHGLSG